jgi:hypothetical protein
MFGFFKSKPPVMTLERAEKVVNAFGGALMKKPTTICDEGDLPYSKAEIKEAFHFWLRSETDPVAIDELKAGYVSLADFMTLTAREKAVSIRFDASSLKMPDTTDPQGMEAFIQGFSEYQGLLQRMAEEAKLLLAEVESKA